MNLNFSWMESAWTQALGWTFVHSIWQIGLIGLALFVVLRFVPKRNANVRYTISTLALWLIVCTTLSTFLIMLPTGSEIIPFTSEVLFKGGTSTMTLTQSIAAWLELRIPMMLTIWAGGVTILMIRLLISLAWVRQIRTTSVAEYEVQQTLNSIISRLKLKIQPRAASSAHVPSPVTIGHLKPLILFPIGMINQISPKEVEAILTHELAHIIRKDYISNLVQSFIETLFYYHPITWWISGMVRSERENRADDLAVTWCGDQLGYAKALMAVQEIQIAQGGPSLAIGFSSHKGAMLTRIKRILNVPYKTHNQMEKTVLLSLTTLCFLAFTLTSHTKADQLSNEDVMLETTLTVSTTNTDSIPTSGTYRIHKKTNEQDISVEVEDGAIKELKVDGKEVPPSDYDAYDITVNEMFGNMQAPGAIQHFNFDMPSPPPPPMPEGLYEFDYDFEMPAMPDMPEMNIDFFVDGQTFFPEGGQVGDVQIFTRRMDDGKGTVMIFVDGDTIVQEINLGNWIDVQEEFLDKYKYKGKENIALWNEQKEQYRNELQRQKDALNQQKDALRYEIRRHEELENGSDKIRNEILLRQNDIVDGNIELENFYGPSANVFALRSNRLSLSEEMVNDGLVKPGTEIDVQLTPNRLKINGEKMPDAIHEKYLKLYESQQGVELSGKSKVEFTTKSKVRM